MSSVYEALLKFQNKLKGVKKDSLNPHFKSKYVSLSALFDAIGQPLSENGLVLHHEHDNTHIEKGLVGVTSIVTHVESQTSINTTLYAKPVKGIDPQSVGGCVTYLTRYGSMSLLGLAPEDDDGNAASGRIEASVQTYSRPQSGSLTEPQLKRLFAISKQSGWKESEIKAYMMAHFQASSTKDLTRSQYDQLCSEMEDHPKK